MFQVDGGRPFQYCDGLSRRSFVRLGVAGMANLSLAQMMQARAASPATSQRRATSVILIWLDGGPSHLDLYDMKPEAPVEYRGLWNPIPTNVPGFEITELFPKQAKLADRFSIVRSLQHHTGDHFAGAHRMLTTKNFNVDGNQTSAKFPSIGAFASRQLGARQPGMPAYVAIPYASSVGLNPGYFGGHLIGAQYDPFPTGGDPNATNFQVQNLNPLDGLSISRLEDRRTLHGHLDRIPRAIDNKRLFSAMDGFEQEAFAFVAGSAARKAFDISQESAETRERYGRQTWGQSTLLARRLVEAGSTFVTVHMGGWDNHWDLKSAMESYLPQVDSALSALFTDLVDRGLWDSTLVVMCGEFSRTPRMNDGGNGGPPLSKGTPGRDHWGEAMFCLMGGGGVKGGQIIGATDRTGSTAIERAVTPCHIHSTIYRVLGLDPTLHVFDPTGRPVPALETQDAIHELLT